MMKKQIFADTNNKFANLKSNQINEHVSLRYIVLFSTIKSQSSFSSVDF